jgi:hypothetical protein
MAKKSTVKKYLPWLLVGGAAIAAYMYFKPQPTDATAPPLPPLPPNTPPEDTTPAPVPVPIVPQPVQIGKPAKVKPNTKAYGAITAARGTLFLKGGSDSFGALNAGAYAGTVQEVNNQWSSARVENYQYPMKDATNKNIYSYWLKLSDLEGNY